MEKNAKIFVSIIVVLVLGILGIILWQSKGGATSVPSGKYDTFAQCLKDKNAIFYGAFWCPHCQATKKMFGSSAKFLPYVECSTPDATAQTQACLDKKITTYPTWIFADGSELNGETTFQQLADKTSCVLPQ